MDDQKVLYEVKDKIAWITLNRPESLNAVNRDMVKLMVGYCREANEDRTGVTAGAAPGALLDDSRDAGAGDRGNQ